MKAIVMYHSIDESGSPISIDAAAFRRHVEWFASGPVRVVSVDELLRLPAHESAAAITFDDAFANFADVAWPLLRAHALPVTVYVPTAHVGGTNAWSSDDRFIPSLPVMNWEALSRLAAEGVIIGSHTCTHPHLARLAQERVRLELEQSAEDIESRLGLRPAGLAYPYGSHDPRTASVAAMLYEHACTTELRTLHAKEDAHQLPRLDAYYLRTPGMLESWGSPQLALYLHARAGARRARSLFSIVPR